MSGIPGPQTAAFICAGCNDWQIDVTPRAVSDLGGAQPAILAVADEHRAHLDECPGGTTGRVKVRGQWVDRPHMSDGSEVTGMLEGHPLPRWWVWR